MILYAGFISRDSGTSERVFEIAENLAKKGVNILLSGVPKDPPENSRIHLVRMPSRITDLPGIISWIIQLVTIAVTEGRYHVIQVESFSSLRSLVLYLILCPFGRRFVVVFHDSYLEYDPRKSIIGRFNLALQRILLTLSDASITPGLSVKRRFMEIHGGLADGKMIVMPNGAPRFETSSTANALEIRKNYGIDPTAFVALFFGSMTFRPNYDAALYLYEKSALVAQEFEKKTRKKLVFVVAGNDSETLPKTGCYVPIGFVKELAKLFALPDTIVLPHSVSDSGPHVKTMYAFLSRKPVIATDDAVKDMPSLVQGLHFLPLDINDPSALASRLSELYFDAELRQRLASGAYLYSKELSWARISGMHIRLYRQLLLDRRSKSRVLPLQET